MSTDLAIEASGLTKVYRRAFGGGFTAVRGLDLAVPRGEVYGFLGPNGAGKTTSISMLLGLVHPTGGQARVLGRPLGDVVAKRQIGYLPEKFQFHDFLRADEFLRLHGRLAGLDGAKLRRRAGETLELVGLAKRATSRIREFSKGMQQRLGLAQALIADPELIILDEPTSALDPLGRRDVRAVIQTLRERGATVFLNSHLLSEVEMTCDRVAILKGGEVVRQGTLEELRPASAVVHLQLETVTTAVLEALGRVGTVAAKSPTGVTVSLGRDGQIPEVAAAVVQAGGRLLEMQPERATLEEIFIATIQGEA